MSMQLDGSIEQINGAGSAMQAKLKKLQIYTVRDLLLHTPFRYEDFSKITTVKDIQPGSVSLKGRFKNVRSRRGRRGGLHITQAVFDDGTGGVEVTWFNQPYRDRSLVRDTDYYLSGHYQFNRDRFSIINPDIERAAVFRKNTARIRGVYPETKGLRSSTIRKLQYEALKHSTWDEDLPLDLLKRYSLPPKSEAVQAVHFPKSKLQLEAARKRFEFDEVFELILAAQLIRRNILELSSHAIDINPSTLKALTKQLPFSLTNAQRKAAWEIVEDLSSTTPMNRLLEGDVGSGKTVVAALATRSVIDHGGQVCVVAPTELVAKQHHELFQGIFGKAVKLLTSSTKSRTKSTIKRQLASGETSVIVGTHALLQPDIAFKHLDLLVIDEQHRFGVEQRQVLTKQHNIVPHVLSMTATPIPRTLALSVYSDLDISVIDELPPGRRPTKTYVLGPSKRPFVQELVAQELTKNHQVYVVCPLIDESDTLGVSSVKQETKAIAQQFPSNSIAGLHGSLSSHDKDEIMNEFRKGNVDILVSTTVVEVGVNVPNATVMLIEGAERFGLAQLHQLRGRVGRASHQSYCLALTTQSGMARNRLSAFESTTDGFKLAELDLSLRGGGQLLGTMQSGELSFKHASLSNLKLIKVAKEAVGIFLENHDLVQYPLLSSRLEQYKTMKRLN